MRPIPPAVARRLEGDLLDAWRSAAAGDVVDAWASLEEAHVLSQPWVRPHVRVHWRMLDLAVRTRDRREVGGQVVRLVLAAPGSLAHRYPAGNTGRARVGLMSPMPISDEIERLLEG